MDAPLHFVEGAPGVEALRLGDLVGPAVVVEAPELPDDVELPAGAERILFKTRNSELWARDAFAEDFVTVGLPLARRLAEERIRLVGIDYLSVGDPGSTGCSSGSESSSSRGSICGRSLPARTSWSACR